MTTEGTEAKPGRRIRIRTVVALIVAAAAIGSLALLAVVYAAATAPAAETPTGLLSGAPSAIDPSASAEVGETPTPAVSPLPTPTPPRTPSVREFLVAKGTEPTVSADPFHPGVVAVISQNLYMHSATNGCGVPTVRVSSDGGATWGSPTRPWANGCQDIHATIAWGPNSRLWAANAMGVTGGVAMSVSHSDDFGKHWSAPFIEHFTKPWSGCYGSITVDNSRASPNFGTVYVAYNWLPNGYGPGAEVIASRDGTTWSHAGVPLETLPGYPFGWRIGYRIKTAPDGTAFVSLYQSDLGYWRESKMFDEGWGSNIGRRGFEIARIHFTGGKLTADPPAWATDVDHAEAAWDSGLAVDQSGRAWLAVETAGRISLGSLDGAWRQFSVTGKISVKPSLAIEGQVIFVGWHAYDYDGRTWTYYSLSYDGGQTFLPPAQVTDTSWYPPTNVNGVGLRENADFANGVVYYAYGDARSGNNVYVAQIHP